LFRAETFPQGLKACFLHVAIGTAEAVPFQDIEFVDRFLASYL